MIKEIIAALIETPESRRIFRTFSTLIFVLVALSLSVFILVSAHRAYVGAPIEFWVFKIGANPSYQSKPAVEDGASAATFHNAAFAMRSPGLTWETEEACVKRALQVLTEMKLPNIGRNQTLVWGATETGWLLAGCSDASLVAVVFANNRDEVNRRIELFLASLPE